MWKRTLSFSVLTSLFLAGCTFASLGGRFADWYAMKKLDDYFDLTVDQEQYLEPRVKHHIAWLKQSELPMVNEDLAVLAQKIEGGISGEDLDWVFARFERLKQSVHQRLHDDAVWLLSRIEKAQIEHRRSEIEKRKERWEKAIKKGPKEYRESRLERYEETFEDWFGSISKEQKETLYKIYGDLAELERGTEYHQGWVEAQERFLTIISPPADGTKVKRMVTEWVDDPSALRSEEGRERYQNRMQFLRDSFLAIDKMITAEQRSYLLKKIRSYRQDIEDFSKAPG